MLTVFRRLRERLRRKRTHTAHCMDGCEHRADQELDSQATRLRVLELEAYGNLKKRNDK